MNYYFYNGKVYKKIGVLKDGRFILQSFVCSTIEIVVKPGQCEQINFLPGGYVSANSHLMFR